MQRRKFMLTGATLVLSGWLGVGHIRPTIAAAPTFHLRRTEREIQVLGEDGLTWQVTLRLQEGLRVGRVWQQGDLLRARIYNGVHSFVLTSSDGTRWKSS